MTNGDDLLKSFGNNLIASADNWSVAWRGVVLYSIKISSRALLLVSRARI